MLAELSMRSHAHAMLHVVQGTGLQAPVCAVYMRRFNYAMYMQVFPDFGSTLHGELEIFRREISSREETHRREILELSKQIEASLHLFQQQQQPPSQSETDARLDKLTEAVQALSLGREGREPRSSDTGAKIDALQTAIQGLKAPQDGGGRRHSESNDR